MWNSEFCGNENRRYVYCEVWDCGGVGLYDCGIVVVEYFIMNVNGYVFCNLVIL